MIGVFMRKMEKIYQVKNIRSSEVFLTSTVYEKNIEGVEFIGVWKESQSNPRILWMRRDSLVEIK